MKTKIKILSVLAALCAGTAVCGAQPVSKVTVHTIKGPSAVALVRLFEQAPRLSGYEIKTETVAQADLLAALFISGEAKIGILPPNVAAKIASSGRKIQLAAVTGNGMLSLLSGDPAVRRIEELRGKTVEVAGQGATPDFVFRKILAFKGLVPGRDIHLGYALAYPEIAGALAAGRIQFALLPEPFASMARAGNPKIAAIGNIQGEWKNLHGDDTGAAENFPMTALVVNAEFAAANGALITTVLESVKNSIQWVNAYPAQAGPLAEKHGLGIRASVLAAAIPASNYAFVPLPEARPALEALFSAFLEFAPASIGGALPSDDFYYNSRTRR